MFYFIVCHLDTESLKMLQIRKNIFSKDISDIINLPVLCKKEDSIDETK